MAQTSKYGAAVVAEGSAIGSKYGNATVANHDAEQPKGVLERFTDPINPMHMVRALLKPSDNPNEDGRETLGKNAMAILQNIKDASRSHIDQSKLAEEKGDYVSAIGHAIYSVPAIGQMADTAMQDFQNGNIAGGIGGLFGLLGPKVAKEVIKANPQIGEVVSKTKNQLVAGTKGAVSEVIANPPKYGPIIAGELIGRASQIPGAGEALGGAAAVGQVVSPMVRGFKKGVASVPKTAAEIAAENARLAERNPAWKTAEVPSLAADPRIANPQNIDSAYTDAPDPITNARDAFNAKLAARKAANEARMRAEAQARAERTTQAPPPVQESAAPTTVEPTLEQSLQQRLSANRAQTPPLEDFAEYNKIAKSLGAREPFEKLDPTTQNLIRKIYDPSKSPTAIKQNPTAPPASPQIEPQLPAPPQSVQPPAVEPQTPPVQPEALPPAVEAAPPVAPATPPPQPEPPPQKVFPSEDIPRLGRENRMLDHQTREALIKDGWEITPEDEVDVGKELHGLDTRAKIEVMSDYLKASGRLQEYKAADIKTPEGRAAIGKIQNDARDWAIKQNEAARLADNQYPYSLRGYTASGEMTDKMTKNPEKYGYQAPTKGYNGTTIQRIIQRVENPKAKRVDPIQESINKWLDENAARINKRQDANTPRN